MEIFHTCPLSEIANTRANPAPNIEAIQITFQAVKFDLASTLPSITTDAACCPTLLAGLAAPLQMYL